MSKLAVLAAVVLAAAYLPFAFFLFAAGHGFADKPIMAVVMLVACVATFGFGIVFKVVYDG